MLRYILAFITLCFFTLGYWFSDSRYYSTVLRENNLNTPQEVLHWMNLNFSNHGINPVHHYASPKHLLQVHKGLYCDEGAIIMATLDHKLNYQTQLLDFVGADNDAHHTLLQIFSGRRWVNVDFTTRKYDESLANSAKALKINLKKVKIKPYPTLYNTIINNNYFLKKIAFYLRGIDENEL